MSLNISALSVYPESRGAELAPTPQKLHTGAVFVLLGSESSASRMCEVPDLSAEDS